MPLQATSGAASYDAFGGGVAAVPNYIEDVFSTWLYTGNGSTQTITNGIDLAGKGGMVWGKTRDAVVSHTITDTVRGVDKEIFPNLTDAQATRATGTGSVYAFNSNGFSTSGVNGFINYSGLLAATWTFREQPKFFDVVTYTGTGSLRTVAHSLGSVPGCIIIKQTSSSGNNWKVYHRSLGGTKFLNLSATTAAGTDADYWNNTDPTATEFTVNIDSSVNASGSTYVAYLFAHNAGGFGLTGTDNVISCGSFETAGNPGNATVNLGYEPQWVMIKRSSSTGGNWSVYDNMRGWGANTTSSSSQVLRPNTSQEELADSGIGITSTGFQISQFSNTGTYIYIAIRRGPMAVPTTGTSVFAPVVYAGNGTTQNITSGFANDMQIIRRRASAENNVIEDKLRGSRVMFTNTTDSELTSTGDVTGYLNTGFTLGASNQGSTNDGGSPSYISWNFRRAPGFFDEVCYTGTGGSNQSFAHNLGVVPELVIYKSRSAAGNWPVWSSTSALGSADYLRINTTAAKATFSLMSSSPSSSLFYVASGNDGSNNGTGTTYVAYLFASCPGVQSIQSFVGDGTTGRTINCGFTGGARFVCIKATSTTGSWWTFDSARGIVTNNDPALQLNSTAAEVTSADAIDTAASGFIVNQESTCSLNASGVTYLVWAIA